MTSWISSWFSTEFAILDKATSNDENPTPGYVYNEINELTFQSSTQCDKIVQTLFSKLEHSSPHVRLKALKVMKHLLEKGHPSCRLEMQKKSELFRPSLTFAGPPDPLRGNAPYVAVQEEARQVFKLLFDSEIPKSVPVKTGQSAITNFTPGHNTLSTSPKDAHQAASFSSVSPKSAPKWGPSGELSNFGNPNIGEVMTSMPSQNETKSEPVMVAEPKKRPESNVAEVALVDEFTSPVGIRLIPNASELAQFLKRIRVLNADMVVKRLDEKLYDTDWQTRLKAMCVIEAMLLETVPESIAHFNKENMKFVQTMNEQREAVQLSLREKAEKILQRIGSSIPSEPPQSVTVATPNPQPQANPKPPLPSLIDTPVPTTSSDMKPNTQAKDSLFKGLHTPNLQAPDILPPLPSSKISNDIDILLQMPITNSSKPLPKATFAFTLEPEKKDPFEFVSSAMKHHKT